ncbi:MAG: DUF2752 domain-containing protein [Bacteroidetes bacterium]|nr:DUF2752 domain-containing protein [Bacteroidota bacterium]
MSVHKRWYVWVIVLATLLCLVFVYKNPPANNVLYPKCVFKQITTFECAGCGSARAVYALLHADLKQAADYNLLLVILIPMGMFVFLNNAFSLTKSNMTILKKPYFYLGLIMLFWILRNVNYFPFTYLHSDN